MSWTRYSGGPDPFAFRGRPDPPIGPRPRPDQGRAIATVPPRINSAGGIDRPKEAPHLPDQVDPGHRVAAEVEEVVMHADGFDLQHAGPERCQSPLEPVEGSAEPPRGAPPTAGRSPSVSEALFDQSSIVPQWKAAPSDRAKARAWPGWRMWVG